MMRAQQRVVGIAVTVAVVVGLIVFFGWIFPTTYPATDTRLVAQAFYIAIAATGLNILTGYNGQVSIGHGAFFGVGAYVSALLMSHQYTWFGITFGNTSFVATLLPCAIVTFVIGALVGFPALRVKGLYLALVTLGLAVIFPDFATRFVKGTGGTSLVALTPVQVAAPSWFPEKLSAPDQWAYMMSFAFAIAGVVVVWVIARSRYGRSLIAVRDHEAAAASVGINLSTTKVLAFALSAMYAGLAGSLSVLVVTNASADPVATFQISIEFLVALVIGGTATVIGALIGGFAVVYIDKWTKDAFPNKPVVSPAIFGIALILLMYILPDGVVGGVRRLFAAGRRTLRLRRTSPATPATHAST